MATWKLAPALAAGNCVVLKPAEQTPASILVLMELIGDLLPAGVINVVNGYGAEAGEALATSKRIAKIAFTGSTPVGSHILECAAANIIPSTVELGGKSPNIYFADIMNAEPEFIDKAVEGLVLAFLNQGEVCTCPSRALIQESMYDDFMGRVVERTRAIKRGNPLDTEVQVGAQASQEQFDKIMSYMDIAREEGAEFLTGGERESFDPAYDGGFYIQPTLLKGNNRMRVFQEEIFGPVVGVTTFKDEAEALAIANDTEFGLGAGIWSRDINVAFRMGRGIQPDECGPTATTSTRRMPPSGATRNLASDARLTRWRWNTTSRPRTCWSAMTPIPWLLLIAKERQSIARGATPVAPLVFACSLRR